MQKESTDNNRIPQRKHNKENINCKSSTSISKKEAVKVLFKLNMDNSIKWGNIANAKRATATLSGTQDLIKLLVVLILYIFCAATVTFIPAFNLSCSGEASNTIFTGKRCSIFTKLPVALSGLNKENSEPAAGEKEWIFPLKIIFGKASARISISLLVSISPIWVSLKFATIHFSCETTCTKACPSFTSCPTCMLRVPTHPS